MISSAVRILLFHTAARLKLALANTAQHRRTVRGPLADCPQCISAVENFSAEPLVNKSHELRTVRLLPTDRPLYQISDSPEFCQLSQFQLQFGIIAHIKIQKSQILHENLQKTHMSKLQQEFKNKSSKIMKTHKWLKNTSKNQKKETKSAWKNHMPHVLVFKPHLRSQWYLVHFSTCKTKIHPNAWWICPLIDHPCNSINLDVTFVHMISKKMMTDINILGSWMLHQISYNFHSAFIITQ